jgi:hypothetical protein
MIDVLPGHDDLRPVEMLRSSDYIAARTGVSGRIDPRGHSVADSR